jgi:predicted enzyme related to lactoylglutathione lyase
MSVKSICGVIIVSNSPDSLVKFYSEVLDLEFEHENHGGLAPHWGADIGTIHLGIHPPENFNRKSASVAGTVVTFDVDSIVDCQGKIEKLGGKCIAPAHDEGFGQVASFLDPQGNQFEIVELSYQFQY